MQPSLINLNLDFMLWHVKLSVAKTVKWSHHWSYFFTPVLLLRCKCSSCAWFAYGVAPWQSNANSQRQWLIVWAERSLWHIPFINTTTPLCCSCLFSFWANRGLQQSNKKTPVSMGSEKKNVLNSVKGILFFLVKRNLYDQKRKCALIKLKVGGGKPLSQRCEYHGQQVTSNLTIYCMLLHCSLPCFLFMIIMKNLWNNRK